MSAEALWLFLADHWLPLLSVICLLLLSAFFSGSEAALTAASRARMHTLDGNGDRRAGVVNRLIERRDRLVGTLLLGNNLVTILATSLTTSLLIGLVGNFAVLVATLSMHIGRSPRFARQLNRLTKSLSAIINHLQSLVTYVS